MEYLPSQSKPGYFNSYADPNSEKVYIVLDGLELEDAHQPGTLETFFSSHYANFEFFYWILFLTTVVYVAGSHVLIPLVRKLKDK